MTFRRRLLVVTLTVGGGVCCFQPLMRSRMEARLSELIGAKATIGSSKISLRDSTIALSDITVLPRGKESDSLEDKTFGQMKIGQAALRFSWSSLLYRNLKVDKVLASNVKWELAAPSQNCIPIASENADLSLFHLSNLGADVDGKVESIIQPIKLRLTEESSRQNGIQQKISLQLKSIADRISEIMPTDESINLLRQQPFVVANAKKELNDLFQLIAEDKNARTDAEKAIASLKSSAQKQFKTTIDVASLVPSDRVHQAAIQLAKLAIAKQWNQSRPVIQATISSLTSLQNLDCETEMLSSQLPVGMTHCSAGKFGGSLQLPNAGKESVETDFVLQFWNLSSRSQLEDLRPSVTLRLNREPKQDKSFWMNCSAQQLALPQSETSQVQVALESNDENGGLSTAKIQHANRGWAATLTLPTRYCLELPAIESMATDAVPIDGTKPVTAKLLGTTSMENEVPNDLLVEIDASSIATLEKFLTECFKSDLEKGRLQASTRGTELIDKEFMIVNSRWEQLGDEFSRAHENWKARIAELKLQLQQVESAFKRTSRASSQITR